MLGLLLNSFNFLIGVRLKRKKEVVNVKSSTVLKFHIVSCWATTTFENQSAYRSVPLTLNALILHNISTGSRQASKISSNFALRRL